MNCDNYIPNLNKKINENIRFLIHNIVYVAGDFFCSNILFSTSGKSTNEKKVMICSMIILFYNFTTIILLIQRNYIVITKYITIVFCISKSNSKTNSDNYSLLILNSTHMLYWLFIRTASSVNTYGYLCYNYIFYFFICPIIHNFFIIHSIKIYTELVE